MKINMERLGNPWGPSPIIEQQRERIINEAEGIGSDKARQLLKISIGDWLDIPVERIGLGQGSTEIIEIISSCMLANQPVVMPVPTYFGLTSSLIEAGSAIVPVPVGTVENFALDQQAAQKLVQTCQEQQAHLWLCTPNNPTGSVMEVGLIEQIVKQLPNQLVIVDEAYLEYIDPANQTSAVKLVDQFANLIVTKTLSKAFGLPDLRMGIVIAHPQIINDIEEHVSISQPVDYIKARYAIEDQEHLHKLAEWIEEELARVKQALQAISNIEASVMSATGVMILRHKMESLHQVLEELGISSKDMNQEPGIEGEGYVRIGLQRSEVNGQFLYALANIFSSPIAQHLQLKHH